MIKSRKLSIVIPVYNEEKFVEETIKRVMLQKVKYFKYKEVIVVNDGSTDSTGKILNKLKTKYKDKLQVINKKVNQGKGAALKAGFKKTTGDVVIVQDADLEYSPSDYDILLEPFVEHNADVVYGSRLNIYRPHRVMYFWHSVANNILTTFSNMFTNLNLSDMETGFKCFRGDLIRKIAPEIRSKRFGFEPEITARIAKIKGIRFYEVGISYGGRTYEEGKKIGWKDGVKAFWEVIKYNLLD